MRTSSLIIISICLFCCTVRGQEEMATSEELQEWIGKDKESTRAKNGDQVLIVIIQVKSASKQDFDAWIEDVLYAALHSTDSEMKMAQLKATRWLTPVSQNADGTWTYSWIMDPVIPKTNYDIPRFLNLEYGEELGNVHWQKYLSFLAVPPQAYVLQQTDL